MNFWNCWLSLGAGTVCLDMWLKSIQRDTDILAKIFTGCSGVILIAIIYCPNIAIEILPFFIYLSDTQSLSFCNAMLDLKKTKQNR